MNGSTELSNILLVAPAIGIAAYGVVELLKLIPIVSDTGLRKIQNMLTSGGTDKSDTVYDALGTVYGMNRNKVHEFLACYYRKDQGDQALGKLLKEGLRMIMLDPRVTQEKKDYLTKQLFIQSSDEIAAAVHRLTTPTPPGKAAPVLNENTTHGQFERSVDAQIDAATAAASIYYTKVMRSLACLIALCFSIIAFFVLQNQSFFYALAIGLVATTIAPTTRDLAGLVSSSRNARIST